MAIYIKLTGTQSSIQLTSTNPNGGPQLLIPNDGQYHLIPDELAQLKGVAKMLADGRLLMSTASDGSAPVTQVPAPGSSSAAPAGLALQHDFTNDPNGTPVTADTGQTWELYQLRPASAPIVSGGRYISNDTASGLASSYLGVGLANPVTYMEANFDFVAGGTTTGGGPVLIASAASLSSSIGANALNATAHVAFSVNGYQVGVFNNSTTQTMIGSYTYATPFTTQTQHVEVGIDSGNGYLYVRGADGVVSRYSSSVVSSVIATHATAEVYYTAANTDQRIRYQSFSADTGSLTAQGATKTRLQELLSDYAVAQGLTGYAKTSDVVNYAAPLVSPTFTGHVTVPTPTTATDAVTKGYVDGLVVNRVITVITTATTLASAAASSGGLEYVYVLTASAAVPTLPTAVGNINRYTIKNGYSASITIATTSSQTIDGSASWSLSAGASIDLISDNANWRIV